MPLARDKSMFSRYDQLRYGRYVRRHLGVIVFGALALFASAIVIFVGNRETPLRPQNMIYGSKTPFSPVTNEIFQAIKEGSYENITSRIAMARAKNPDDASLSVLHANLMNELKIDVKFHYYLERKKYHSTRMISRALSLTPLDAYYFTVSPSDNCYLFIFQVDSKGNATTVYPNKEYSPSQNPLLPGLIRIPDSFKCFYLDTTKGIETVYLFATRLENKKLEKWSNQINSEQRPQVLSQLAGGLVSYFKANETIAEKVPGIVLRVYQFTHG